MLLKNFSMPCCMMPDVAAKNLNRKFIGIELDEGYFNIAKERINGGK